MMKSENNGRTCKDNHITYL